MSNHSEASPTPDSLSLELKDGALCVVAPEDFAEACFSVPSLRALKRLCPMNGLMVLCPEFQLPLWKSLSEVDDVIVYPEKMPARKIVRLLENWDTSFNSAIIWEAGEPAKALARVKIPQRFGYPARGLEKWLTDSIVGVVNPGPIEHRVRYYLHLAQSLGADAFVKSNFQTLPLDAPPQKIKIAWAPESEYGESYQWPREKMDEVKRLLDVKFGAIDWVLFNKNQKNPMPELAGCSALLACDGEVAHWAAHVGLPAVVIFGPGEPAWRRPLGKQSRVVRDHVACSPCYLAKCPLDLRCQTGVSVEIVVDALEKALSDR